MKMRFDNERSMLSKNNAFVSFGKDFIMIFFPKSKGITISCTAALIAMHNDIVNSSVSNVIYPQKKILVKSIFGKDG